MQMPGVNSCAILLLVHELVNSIRNTAVRCYTGQHNTVTAAKDSTLERAWEGRDAHGDFRHGAILLVR